MPGESEDEEREAAAPADAGDEADAPLTPPALPEEFDAEAIPDGDSPGRHEKGAFVYWEERGPLPNREWLEVAERHAPGVTQRLVDDLIAHREHAREMEARAVYFDEHSFGVFAKYQTTQLWMAFLLAVFIAAGGIVLALDGRSVEGFAVLIAEVTALVLAFLYGRSRGQSQDDS